MRAARAGKDGVVRALTTGVPGPWRVKRGRGELEYTLILGGLTMTLAFDVLVYRTSGDVTIEPFGGVEVTHAKFHMQVYTGIRKVVSWFAMDARRREKEEIRFEIPAWHRHHLDHVEVTSGPWTDSAVDALDLATKLFPGVLDSPHTNQTNANAIRRVLASKLRVRKNTRHLPPRNLTDPVSLNMVDPRNAYYFLPNVLPNGRIQSVYGRATIDKVVPTGRSPTTRRPIGRSNVGRIDIAARERWRAAIRKVVKQKVPKKTPSKKNGGSKK